ncbi:hypothetical protein [Capnocytophaga catalasegens]|nr:hypothetical protein [Capnocytophaga catalasegens]
MARYLKGSTTYFGDISTYQKGMAQYLKSSSTHWKGGALNTVSG